MIIDIFGSLRDNLVKKVRNPFFGTLTIVFVLKNWQMFYSLLFFDAGTSLSMRIEYIKTYIDDAGGTLSMFGFAVLYTFAVLIMSYLLQGLGAYISNFYDSILDPWIIKCATKGASIVTLANHEKEKSRGDQLEQKLKEEREKRLATASELEKVEKEFANYRAEKREEVQDTEVVNLAVKEAPKTREEKIALKIYNNTEWRNQFETFVQSFKFRQNANISSLDKEFYKYLQSQNVIIYVGDPEEDYYEVITEFGHKVNECFLDLTAA